MCALLPVRLPVIRWFLKTLWPTASDTRVTANQYKAESFILWRNIPTLVYMLCSRMTLSPTQREQSGALNSLMNMKKKDGNHMVLTSHSSHLLDDAFGHSWIFPLMGFFFVCLFVCFFPSQLSIVELDYENAITAMTLAHFRELGG